VGTYGGLFKRMTAPFHAAMRIFSRLEVPIVTAAHGAVAGGGLGFVYAADVVIAADDARFKPAFAGLGVSGDGGGTWHLPRKIGPARAARVLLGNETIPATDAFDWGLVSEVVPAEDVRSRAIAFAEQLAAGPTVAFGRMRQLLRESWDNGVAEQLDRETENIVLTGRTADAREAVAAFLDRRQPSFEGR
jgi:2-(1,2-epoxy-1,2-dihydrophenyl)acetyl-CoA isomerase